MSRSIITKKKIAKAFKELFRTESFEKISVGKIMEVAKMRRQTFYDHFLDKYDLLAWIFETELQEQITDNFSYSSGKTILKELCLYFENNQDFYRQLFLIIDQNDFFSSLLLYCQHLVTKIVTEAGIDCQEPLMQDLIHYHALAISETIRERILTHQDLVNSYPIFERALFEMIKRR